MEQEENLIQYPRLRSDLKISKMVQRESIQYVVKDPLKEQYFRFNQDEWAIISLFDGKKTMPEMVTYYNKEHNGIEIDLEMVKNYQESLNSMNILQKNSKDMNVMLVEKMKEMRKSQILSKQGSLLYKRFPFVDPDKLFNKIIPHVQFFWSKPFLIISGGLMLSALLTIFYNWQKFHSGVREIFSFSEMSLINLACLWVIIYGTIAIHEIGHGLTCKYFGGEVHEIGLLILFFQPCLYCNVNDAWLFDKKWKQIMVTIAGGYIEFFIGSIFTFIWVLTNPNTFINIISFQVMTICSISTVLFNFNPLIKLDGYYLLADYLEIPNLKENSGKYIKYLVCKYIFRMDEEEFEGTQREKNMLFLYGTSSCLWTFGTLTGMVVMAQGMLVEKFHATGVLLSGWVTYKILGSHFTKGGKFLGQWIVKNIAFFRQKKGKIIVGSSVFILVALLCIPIHYKVLGDCTLEPNFIRVIRAKSEGKIKKFHMNDGEILNKNRKKHLIARMENFTLEYDRKIAAINMQKVHMKIQKNFNEQNDQLSSLEKELKSKKYELELKNKKVGDLNIIYNDIIDQHSVLSCTDQEKKLNSFLKEGDEICRVLGTNELKTVIAVSERQVKFMKVKQSVRFKLISDPMETYSGHISKIRPSGQSDPHNPKNKIYHAEILIKNRGNLMPGMKGKAKIYAEKVSIIHYIGINLVSILRLDLFY